MLVIKYKLQLTSPIPNEKIKHAVEMEGSMNALNWILINGYTYVICENIRNMYKYSIHGYKHIRSMYRYNVNGYKHILCKNII